MKKSERWTPSSSVILRSPCACFTTMETWLSPKKCLHLPRSMQVCVNPSSPRRPLRLTKTSKLLLLLLLLSAKTIKCSRSRQINLKPLIKITNLRKLQKRTVASLYRYSLTKSLKNSNLQGQFIRLKWKSSKNELAQRWSVMSSLRWWNNRKSSSSSNSWIRQNLMQMSLTKTMSRVLLEALRRTKGTKRPKKSKIC